ncbi:unnamed protein product [Rotaria socialis]
MKSNLYFPGRGRTAENGRKAQESAGKWMQYSSWKLPDFLPVDSDQLPDIASFLRVYTIFTDRKPALEQMTMILPDTLFLYHSVYFQLPMRVRIQTSTLSIVTTTVLNRPDPLGELIVQQKFRFVSNTL